MGARGVHRVGGAVRPGDAAPEVTLVDAQGRSVGLSELRRGRALVLYFYPRDDTPICTQESCSFRDSYEAFLSVGAEVIGVSDDGVESHRSFAAKHRLPFPLMTDPAGAARQAFGVKKTLGFLRGRVTFVIDREGIIRQVFDSQFSAEGHVRTALDRVRALAR